MTIKARKENRLYIKSFVHKGNAKLADYTAEDGTVYRYAQYNLPAKKTCPYASDDCKKFCYAKRDERHTSVRENRKASLVAAQREDFTEAMIFTIETAFMTKRYSNAHMILRVHESGDYFNISYLKAWTKVFNHFANNTNITFCFYTKCFDYLLNLTEEERVIFKALTDSGRVAVSLSLDKSSTSEQKIKAVKVKAMFPAVNIYYAIKADKIDTIEHDDICECKDCAKCAKCVKTGGKTIACAIH